MNSVNIGVKKVPKHIRAKLDSSWNALIDSDSLPSSFKHNASRYLLLVISWELYQMANEEFSAWANKTTPDRRLLRDHGYKLRKSPNAKYIKIVSGKPIETDHKTEDKKKELREQLQYGSNTQSREELFFRGWHFQTFRNTLIGNIKLLKVMFNTIDRWAEEDKEKK